MGCWVLNFIPGPGVIVNNKDESSIGAECIENMKIKELNEETKTYKNFILRK